MALTIGELVEFKQREWPSNPRSEMQRLNQLYGRTGSGDEAPTFAERVYGQDSIGIKALTAAIAEARQTAEGTAKRGRGRPPKDDDLVGATA